MKLKPYKELIKMSKEKLDEALAPMRARQVQAQADLEMSKLEEKQVTLETEIQELTATKTIDFDKLLKKMDEYDLNERRLAQYKRVLSELFPK